MLPRYLRVAAVLLAVFGLLSGCRRHSALEPAGPADTPGEDGLPSLAEGFATGQESLLATFDLAITPTGDASVAWFSQRAGTAHGDIIDLDIGAYPTSGLPRNTNGQLDPWLEVVKVEQGAGVRHVTLRHRHPFYAPAGWAASGVVPNALTQRCDLGYSARAVLLFDVSENERLRYTFWFPGDTRVARTGLLTNADGYVGLNPPGTNVIGDLDPLNGANTPPGVEPATYASAPPVRANTFPYKLVVDEESGVTGNRISERPDHAIISNFNQPTGNYDVTQGGWQRANIGPSYDQWTGYDLLHAGQAADFTMDLVDTFSGTVQLVLLAKWADPRGDGANRRWLRQPVALASGSPDPLWGARGEDPRPGGDSSLPAAQLFGYHMPHGTPDLSKVQSDLPPGPIVLPRESGPGVPVSWTVRDWDANALQTDDLVRNSFLDRVYRGASDNGSAIDPERATGIISCPGVLANFRPLTVSAPLTTTGQPTAVRVSTTLHNEQVAFPGTYRGLIKIVDPESLIYVGVGGAYINDGLTPGTTLTADHERREPLVTFQSFDVTIPPPASAPLSIQGLPADHFSLGWWDGTNDFYARMGSPDEFVARGFNNEFLDLGLTLAANSAALNRVRHYVAVYLSADPRAGVIPGMPRETQKLISAAGFDSPASEVYWQQLEDYVKGCVSDPIIGPRIRGWHLCDEPDLQAVLWDWQGVGPSCDYTCKLDQVYRFLKKLGAKLKEWDPNPDHPTILLVSPCVSPIERQDYLEVGAPVWCGEDYPNWDPAILAGIADIVGLNHYPYYNQADSCGLVGFAEADYAESIYGLQYVRQRAIVVGDSEGHHAKGLLLGSQAWGMPENPLCLNPAAPMTELQNPPLYHDESNRTCDVPATSFLCEQRWELPDGTVCYKDERTTIDCEQPDCQPVPPIGS
ncbi:MAG: hypothetical protein ABI743_03845, partial [bacterium]